MVTADPTPAMSAIPAAAPVGPTEERTTVSAIAVVPEVPASEKFGAREVHLVDDRVDALLRENLELMKERKALYDVADARWARSTEMLEELRTAKRLVRAFLAAETGRGVGDILDTPEAEALREWAAKPI